MFYLRVVRRKGVDFSHKKRMRVEAGEGGRAGGDDGVIFYFLLTGSGVVVRGKGVVERGSGGADRRIGGRICE